MTSADQSPAPIDSLTARERAAVFGLPSVDLTGWTTEPAVLARVPREIAELHGLLPLAERDGRIQVAISDPLQTEGIDLLAARLGCVVEPSIAPADEIVAAIRHAYDEQRGRGASAAIDGSEVPDAPVILQVRAIIEEAMRRGASDIHIEPLAGRLRVRYRVDGVLTDAPDPPSELRAALLSRLKLMANLSIAEKRQPQDGRIGFASSRGTTVDLRVSCIPTIHGESMVLRILDPATLKRGLPELGFSPDHREQVDRLLSLADGLVLVTGPTGSGKTTTLYSFLEHLNQSDRKIITVEDPVEYQLPGITQVPVRPAVGMTFAAALRAILRQSPNVIMIGEIRDRETAEIALQAALTGHLVFSTLHTNDAPGAVARLLDLRVRPHLLAAALRATIAQRLVRRVCPHCRSAGRQVDHVDAAGPAGARCMHCGGAGHRGRIGLFEILQVSDESRRIICENGSPVTLRTHARSSGMRTMREDGIGKAASGLTTLEEVLAITADDPAELSRNPRRNYEL